MTAPSGWCFCNYSFLVNQLCTVTIIIVNTVMFELIQNCSGVDFDILIIVRPLIKPRWLFGLSPVKDLPTSVSEWSKGPESAQQVKELKKIRSTPRQ